MYIFFVILARVTVRIFESKGLTLWHQNTNHHQQFMHEKRQRKQCGEKWLYGEKTSPL